eukprot:TRINITY_DN9390_c0_g1_i2.p1 TRINITY_DN9390_c0_g1~~TRINITY_DN9390_c0_g1_i2.p1  ORF type:complete len:263 (+),score=88.47 TRINITY_DN9390_c0_g1_i2:96-791(+)
MGSSNSNAMGNSNSDQAEAAIDVTPVSSGAEHRVPGCRAPSTIELPPLPTDNDLWDEERAALREVQRASARFRDACHRYEQAERIGRPEAERKRLQERRDEAEDALNLAGAAHEHLSRNPNRRRILACDARPIVGRGLKSRSNPDGVLFLPPEQAVLEGLVVGGASWGKNPTEQRNLIAKLASAELKAPVPPPRPKWLSSWATPAELKAGPTHWWVPSVCGGRLVALPSQC